MSPSKSIVLPIFVILFLCVTFPVFAQTPPPPSQTIGGVTRRERDSEKEKSLEKRVESKKPAAEAQGETEAGTDNGPKFTITTIEVEGSTLLSAEEIKAITSQFEGKEVTLRQAQKAADLITDEYRKKGYVTSRAYIPAQRVQNGILLIRVVEGKLGNLTINGNKYFSTRMLADKFERSPQGYFDYSALQQSLVYINESPDRKASATLMPGKEAGTTDVVISVKDRLPIHASLEYDNWGSRYIHKNRYAGILEDNNLFGFDDKLYLKYQRADSSRMILEEARYLFPVTRDLDIGIYALTSRLRLGKEFQNFDARGNADIYGVFSGYRLISGANLDLRLNAGFDYKRIRNFLVGTQNSRDAVRIAKFGADVDASDSLGRNIILPEIQFGMPNIMGGMDRKNDPFASRSGAGGKFTKGLLSYYRLQKMPLSTTLLWKNYAQYSNNVLVASEEFQIGGPTSVRGYPPGEFAGDMGVYTSPELSMPFYFLPKNWRVPWNQETVYNTTRFVVFYDCAAVKLNSFSSTENKYRTLKGYGFGFRFNLRDNLSCRVEIGYPLGRKPSDDRSAHPWVEFTSKF